MPFVLAAIAIVLGLIGLMVWLRSRPAGREVEAGRARELFVLQVERLEQVFFQAASESGKPRGLIWKRCELGKELELARDRQTGELIGLAPVTIAFEAVPGSDMEGLAAVGHLRTASAVFVFRKGQWLTSGRAVMNLSPAEAIRRFEKLYAEIDEGETGPQ
jgi:hypothetical protein